MSEITWAQRSLTDVTLCWYVGGTPDRGKKENFCNEGTPWVRVEDMTANIILGAAQCLTEIGIQSSNAKLVPPGSVLVSTSGTIGKVSMAGVELTTNQAIQALVINTDIVLPKYVYYYLQFVQSQLLAISNHVTIPNLPKTTLQKFPIFYPSLDEQHVIVAQLDKTENLFYLKRSQFRRLDDYLLSLFTNCFLGEIESSHLLRLDAIAEISSGIRARQSNSDEAKPLVSGFGGQAFQLRDLSSFVKAIPPKNAAKYLLKQNDILIRRKLPTPPQPCAALVSELAESSLLGANLIRIRISDDNILPAYLFAWLVLSHWQGTLPMMDNYHTDVDISRIKSILVPVVPLTSQNRFVYYFDRYLHIFNLVNTTNIRLESLVRNMLEFAFSGKLSYNWRKQNGVPHPSRTIFDIKLSWTYDDETALYQQNLACLTASMRAVTRSMSSFQQALLKQLMVTRRPKAIHELLEELQTDENADFANTYNIQDAIQAMQVLELLGFVECRDILLEIPEYNDAGILMNDDGSPIQIQLQILNRDIFKESSDETPKIVH